MSLDDFEKQLRRRPLRSVPADWREEILKSARNTAKRHPSLSDAEPMIWWREFLLPLRWHLAGISAAWLLFALLNIDPSFTPIPTMAKQDSPSPRQFLMALRESRRQLLELIQTPVTETDPAPRAVVPPRRSELQSSTVMA